LPIGDDNIAEPIAVVITAMSTLLMEMPTRPTRIPAMAIGYMKSAPRPDLAGVGAIKRPTKSA
jgi:hypothetical protein